MQDFVLDEENAVELKLGKLYEDAVCLHNSEVMLLLQLRHDADKAKGEENETINKTLEYVKRFSRFDNKQTISRVRRLLCDEKGLDQFEAAVLSNLCPETEDEAIALVPTLSRFQQDGFGDTTVQSILDELAEWRKPV